MATDLATVAVLIRIVDTRLAAGTSVDREMTGIEIPDTDVMSLDENAPDVVGLRSHGNLHALPSDGRVPHVDEWRWLHTPGHSAGHVSLSRDSDLTLIVGDAFCTTKQESFLAVATQTPELHGPPAYFTTDRDAARRSVAQLAALQPQSIAPGHGRPMAGSEMQAALGLLAAEFDTIARAAPGRYVAHPQRG